MKSTDKKIEQVEVKKKLKRKTVERYKKKVPRITTEEMIEVDRLMMEKYKIELIQMMENAGRNLACLVSHEFLGSKIPSEHIIVLAGTGGNGGGALVAARRLSAWGYNVKVCVTDKDNMTPVPGHQLDILQNMGVEIVPLDKLPAKKEIALVIDGIIGYSIIGDPIGLAAEMIHWANDQDAPIIALDTPSGIDLTEGIVHDPSIMAEATMTLALPKVGLFNPDVVPHRGKLYLADISVPPTLYAEPSLRISVGNIFKKGEILRLE